MDVKGVRDWAEVRALVRESYRLIAPKQLWAIAQGSAPATGKTPARRKTPVRAGGPRGGKRSTVRRSRAR